MAAPASCAAASDANSWSDKLMNRLLKSTLPSSNPIGGMMTSLTIDVTILPNAAPMMIPIAMSRTFPFRANSLNSLSISSLLCWLGPGRGLLSRLTTGPSGRTPWRRRPGDRAGRPNYGRSCLSHQPRGAMATLFCGRGAPDSTQRSGVGQPPGWATSCLEASVGHRRGWGIGSSQSVKRAATPGASKLNVAMPGGATLPGAFWIPCSQCPPPLPIASNRNAAHPHTIGPHHISEERHALSGAPDHALARLNRQAEPLQLLAYCGHPLGQNGFAVMQEDEIINEAQIGGRRQVLPHPVVEAAQIGVGPKLRGEIANRQTLRPLVRRDEIVASMDGKYLRMSILRAKR